MSSNLVANVTISGNLLVQGSYSNITIANTTTFQSLYLTDGSTPYPYVQISGVNLGPIASPLYQLELSTDYARKLTTSTWATGSDERIKNDLESANVARCVEIIQNLDLKRFAWNFPDGFQPNDTHSLGWIAQDVERIFPNSVDTGPAYGFEDFKTLNTDQLIKVMWGALKKLRADLKSQRSADYV